MMVFFFTLASFPEILPVLGSQNRLQQEYISMGGNKQVRKSAHGSSSIIPARKGNGTTNELWYTIP